MKSLALLALSVAISGCARLKPTPGVKVDSPSAQSRESQAAVTKALENSPTFLELKRRSKEPMVSIGDTEDSWVYIYLYSESKDFYHRWATLKVELKSGSILRLGTDENLEDKWFVEFQPQK